MQSEPITAADATMTPQEFARLLAGTHLWPVQASMARRILVDGFSAAAAGREAGRTRSEASRAARTVRAQALVCPTCGRKVGAALGK